MLVGENAPHIVFEGIDGSGKATQYKLLEQRLQKEKISYLTAVAPNYGKPQSLLVKAYLDGEFGLNPEDLSAYEASTTYAFDRSITYKEEIAPHHKNGTLLITDRWATSNILYQAAKLKTIAEKREFIKWACDLEYEKFKISKPDLVFLMLVSPEEQRKILLARTTNKTGTNTDIHEKDLEYQKRVAEHALFCADELGWNIVDAYAGGVRKPETVVHNEIYTAASPLLQRCKRL